MHVFNQKGQNTCARTARVLHTKSIYRTQSSTTTTTIIATPNTRNQPTQRSERLRAMFRPQLWWWRCWTTSNSTRNRSTCYECLHTLGDQPKKQRRTKRKCSAEIVVFDFDAFWRIWWRLFSGCCCCTGFVNKKGRVTVQRRRMCNGDSV